MATLKDIARVCGVSTATVSYVVNKSARPVLPETRDRIQKVIDELGYHPNAHGRGLRGIRTNTIGIVFPHVEAQPFDNAYFGPVIAGIVDVATQRRMSTMMFTALSWEEADASAPRLCDGRCDGFILLAPPKGGRLIRDLNDRQVPIVVVGMHPEESNVYSVDADNREGGRLAVEHLVGLGHRRIAIACGSPHATCAGERLSGYLQALEESGLPVEDSLILSNPGWLDESRCWNQEDGFRELLRNPNTRPTAVFCMQDEIAFSLIEIANEFGLRIPEDLSVVGFDDISGAASFSTPLTTIRQPMRQIGFKAAELVFDRVAGSVGEPSDYLLDVQLIERSSTAAPPKDDSAPGVLPAANKELKVAIGGG